MKEVLVGVGAAFEFVGIILVGSPDVFPAAARVSAWLRARSLRALDPIRRWIGRPRRHVVEAGAAISAEAALSASGIVSIRDEATLEEKVAFLLRRDEESQRGANEFRDRLATLERESSKRLDELRRGMERTRRA